MLDFAIKQNTLALYWDNLDKRVFWMEINNGVKEIKEGLEDVFGFTEIRILNF